MAIEPAILGPRIGKGCKKQMMKLEIGRGDIGKRVNQAVDTVPKYIDTSTVDQACFAFLPRSFKLDCLEMQRATVQGARRSCICTGWMFPSLCFHRM